MYRNFYRNFTATYRNFPGFYRNFFRLGGPQSPPPPKTTTRRNVTEGVGKRAPLTGPLTSYYELRRLFLSIEKMVSIFFPPNIWQMMTFLNPLDALIPKIPFSFFAEILGLGHLRGPGISLGRILAVLSIEPLGGGGGGLGSQGALLTPPPLQLKAEGVPTGTVGAACN